MNKGQRKGKVISALPRLYPTLITDVTSGEVLDWESFLGQSLNPALDWVRDETQRLYDQDPDKIKLIAGELKHNADSHARVNGIAGSIHSLPRSAKAKSRLVRLAHHNLMSETAAFVRNSNPGKQAHSFSRTLTLGAVDKQMVNLARNSHELILTWACWENEYELRFQLPAYIRQRTITKFSLPNVSAKGFMFSVEETPIPLSGPNTAGVDLGRVQPFTMVIVNPSGSVMAERRATPQLLATNTKRERILKEVRATRTKAEAREALGLDAIIQREQVRLLRAKSKRLGASLNAEMGSQIATLTEQHEVSLLRLEDISWASGSKYGSKWAHGVARERVTHSVRRRGGKVQSVNARGTSQHCHACGTKIVHNTKKRTVWCGECKSRLDRDYNAALNIAKNQSYPTKPDGSYRPTGDTPSSIITEQGIGENPNSQLIKMLETLG